MPTLPEPIGAANAALQTLLGVAQLRNTDAETNERVQKVLLSQAELASFEKQQQAVDAYRQETIRRAQMGNPGQNNPNTTSIADTLSQNNPNEAVMAQLQQQVNSVSSQLDLAMKWGVEPEIKRLSSELNVLSPQLRHVSADVTRQRAEDAKEWSQVLAGVKDQPSLLQAMQFGKERFGPKAVAALDAQLPHDPDTLQPVWNEQAKQAIAPFVARYTSMSLEETKNHNAQTIQRQVERDAELARKAREDERIRDQNILQKRDAVETRDKRAASAEAARAARDSGKTTEIKAATTEQKKSARASILSDPAWKDQKFDESVDALAADVADRANAIRVESAKAGELIGLDDARQRAINEYRRFVKSEKRGGTKVLGMEFGGDQRLTYSRTPGPDEKPNDLAKPTTNAEAELKAILTKTGIAFEPDKYVYRVTPNGEVQRKAK